MAVPDIASVMEPRVMNGTVHCQLERGNVAQR